MMKQELHEIYEKYSSDLYAFILRMCRSEQLAKDILQDTMLKRRQLQGGLLRKDVAVHYRKESLV